MDLAELVARADAMAQRLQARADGRAKVVVAGLSADGVTLRVVARDGGSDDVVMEPDGDVDSLDGRFDAVLARLDGAPLRGPCTHAGPPLSVPVGGFVQCASCRLLGVLVGGRVRWAE